VVLNLMINAVEAMSVVEGSRELLISTARGNSHDVLVTVAGLRSGSGRRVPNASRGLLYTKPGGIGIGLSICRSIVDAHGGRLWASASNPRVLSSSLRCRWTQRARRDWLLASRKYCYS